MLNLVEFFAGIGSQSRALKDLKVKFKVTGLSEWFVPAIKAYNLIHSFEEFEEFKKNCKDIKKEKIIEFLTPLNLSFNSKKPTNLNKLKRLSNNELKNLYFHIKFSKEYYNNFFDINKIKGGDLNKIKIDCLTYSFPCQDLSNQGKQKGLIEGKKSKLIWEVLRILKEVNSINKKKLPKMLIMENVSAILNKKNLPKLLEIKSELYKLGYISEFNSYKASDFNSNTIRKRAFMISKLNNKKISWPKIEKNNNKFKTILNNMNNHIHNDKNCKKPFICDLKINELKFRKTNFGLIKAEIPKTSKKYTTFSSENYIFHSNGLAPTLTASGAQSRLKIVDKNNLIRYLIPIECWRLTGFKDDDFNKIKKEITNQSTQIFLVGNSIPVELMKAIFKLNCYGNK